VRHRYLVAGLLVAATALGGCGRAEKAASGPTCARPGAAFDAPATRLTFRVPDASPAQVEQTRRILCARLHALGIDHRVGRTARNDVTVDVARASGVLPPAGRTSIFGPGRLAVYDWEPNVIGPDGKPAPRDPAVTGGPAAGDASAIPLYAAVLRAAKRPAATQADNARASSRFYAVDPKTRRVFGVGKAVPGQSGEPTRAAALSSVPARLRRSAKVYEVKPGTVIVRAARTTDIDDAGAWFVLRDDVALRGSAIVNPRQRFDEGPAATGEPVVTFDFSAAGRPLWERLTRTVAGRGASEFARAGRTGVDHNQHFAVVVDDALLSVPYIDSKRNPDGIDGRAGSQIVGGFTIAGARQLAVLLGLKPLPGALVLIASSAAP
jgi:SecD/SecF fusion protein